MRFMKIGQRSGKTRSVAEGKTTTTSEIPDVYGFSKDALQGGFEGYRREIWTKPAYDDVLNADGRRGRGCMNMTFALVRDTDAICWELFTGWDLPETTEAIGPRKLAITPGIIEFHSLTPLYEDQEPILADKCLVLDGPCYYAQSYTSGDDLYNVLVEGGLDRLWPALKKLLDQQLNDEED